MQFGREPLPKTPEMMTADGERGWVCSKNTGHFQIASERPDGFASDAAQAGGDDDRGNTQE